VAKDVSMKRVMALELQKRSFPEMKTNPIKCKLTKLNKQVMDAHYQLEVRSC